MSELDSKFNRVVIDARKFGVEAQAAKRKKALELRDKGNTFVAIAKELGVHPRTVQHWCAQAGKIGKEAVIKWGRRGVTIGDGRVLSPVQEREIVGYITTQLPGAAIPVMVCRSDPGADPRTFQDEYLARLGPELPVALGNQTADS